MERIEEEDVDCFLLQMEQIFEILPEREKHQDEWHRFPGFAMWIPEEFRPADREVAAEIFWSENCPDTLFFTEGNTAGITLQKSEDAIPSMEDVERVLERLDDRTVCYDMGETEGGIKVYWLEYKSFAADGRVYNVLFHFRAGGNDILGTFYCPFEDYGQWKPTVWDIMQTIKEGE